MGIYFHIPFCKQACHYCDFHFSTSLKHKDKLIEALLNEIDLRRKELQQQPLTTIYFGGGTPSLLSVDEINRLIGQISKHQSLQSVKEITLEANPDDLSKQYVNDLKNTAINRLSIGVQSFFNEDLLWMNRSHTAQQAMEVIQTVQSAGFHQLNIDLIYGSSTTTDEMWAKNLDLWNKMNIPHLSAYCLTVEENTALSAMIKNGKTAAPTDEKGSRQFDYLLNFCQSNKVDAYEISNYCKNKQFALHNTNYWFNQPYVGIGPSAHSYDGKATRRWNISNNVKYINEVNENDDYFTTEELTETEQMNEFILTRIRTKWGIVKKEFTERFSTAYWNEMYTRLHHQLLNDTIIEYDGRFVLTRKGKHIADTISGELFF